VKTTLKGDIVWSKNRPENDEYKDTKRNYKPTNIAFAPNGDLFVADGYGSAFIMKYTKDGKLLKTFGGGGTADGKFRTPHGLWCVPNAGGHAELVVCDRANARLQYFDLEGTHLRTTAKDTVFFPANIDSQKNLMLVPDLHTRVSLYDTAKSEWVAQLGNDDAWRAKVTGSLDKAKGPAVRTQPKEWPAGRFIHPHDACFDASGNIIVAEWVEGGRVSFLKRMA
jgi:hypothetical protein